MLPVNKGVKGNIKTRRAANSFVRESHGGVSIRNISVTTTVKNVNIPDKVQSFYCENVGGNIVAFNFNSDSDNWQLEPGDKMPFPVDTNANTIFNVRSFGGPSNLRCILMG